MKLLWTTAICTGLALGAGPLAAMEKTLSGVEVIVDLSAFDDSNALNYWPTLEDDLERAIAEQVNLDDGADAPRISVEINKVAIDGDTVLPDSGEFNQIEGTVTTRAGINETTSTSSEAAETPDAVIGSYPLQMTAVTGDKSAPEGWIVISPSQGDFYNALIGAYAMSVVERIGD
ncbi:hypothetical protein ACEWPL_001530 [Roseovarius sp. S1116L3]|uniref:hypothetical protein n=1 Tax=Roseovarius roseus TaxID=3342636 RepID=UPI00372C1307